MKLWRMKEYGVLLILVILITAGGTAVALLISEALGVRSESTFVEAWQSVMLVSVLTLAIERGSE